MKLKPIYRLVVGVVILAIIAAVGIRLWAGSKLTAMPRLTTMHAGPGGRLYVMLGDKLYIESDNGQSLDVVPLSRFGIDRFWGDFAVLPDGDIILPARSQPDEDAFDWLGIVNRDSRDPEAALGVPLARCTPATFECETLNGGHYFNTTRTFKIVVDSHRLYVADTAAQRLLILDMTGNILEQKASGVRFPNQLRVLENGKLEVADTNHHRLVTFDVRGDRFGDRPETVSVRDWPLAHQHTFPVGLVRDRAGNQWVIVADDHVENGIVYRRAASGTSYRRIYTPHNSDVLLLATAGDRVFAPDRGLYAIHSWTLDGQPAGDFGSPVLKTALKNLQKQREGYQALFKNSLYALFAILVVVVVVGVFEQYRGASETELAVFEEWPQLPAPTRINVFSDVGSYEFRRRFSGPLSRKSRAMMWAITVVVIAAPFALFALIGLDIDWSKFMTGMLHDPRLWFGGVALLIFLAWYGLSSRFERLTVSRKEIRYTSIFSGPLRFLAPRYPGWTLRWEDVERIGLGRKKPAKAVFGTKSSVLRTQVAGTLQFVIVARDGQVRRLRVYSWRPEWQIDDTGLSAADLRLGRLDAIRAAIARTSLFRVLDWAARRNEIEPGTAAPEHPGAAAA